MMAALDGELADGERAELDRLLAGDPSLREQWDRLRKVKEATGTLAYAKPPDAVWDRYNEAVFNRMERWLSWILLAAGSGVLLLYGLWQLVGYVWDAAALPPLLKWAVFGILAGFALLTVSVARQRVFTYKRDPYRKVKR